jgi:uncharacterized protein (DUF433 family)
MSLNLVADPLPLAKDADGVMRVRNSRVTLDTIVAAYREGMTPESIVDQYPSLKLDEVYSVIGYILKHTSEVEAYLQERHAVAATTRRENEARFDANGIRDRLLARKHQG